MVNTEASEEFLSAVSSGDLDRVKWSLANGAPVDSTDPNGLTALIKSIKLKDISIFKELVKRGAKPEKAAVNGTTPLMVAAALNNIDAAEILIKLRVNINAKDNNLKSAICYAAEKGNL